MESQNLMKTTMTSNTKLGKNTPGASFRKSISSPKCPYAAIKVVDSGALHVCPISHIFLAGKNGRYDVAANASRLRKAFNGRSQTLRIREKGVETSVVVLGTSVNKNLLVQKYVKTSKRIPCPKRCDLSPAIRTITDSINKKESLAAAREQRQAETSIVYEADHTLMNEYMNAGDMVQGTPSTGSGGKGENSGDKETEEGNCSLTIADVHVPVQENKHSNTMGQSETNALGRNSELELPQDSAVNEDLSVSQKDVSTSKESTILEDENNGLEQNEDLRSRKTTLPRNDSNSIENNNKRTVKIVEDQLFKNPIINHILPLQQHASNCLVLGDQSSHKDKDAMKNSAEDKENIVPDRLGHNDSHGIERVSTSADVLDPLAKTSPEKYSMKRKNPQNGISPKRQKIGENEWAKDEEIAELKKENELLRAKMTAIVKEKDKYLHKIATYEDLIDKYEQEDDKEEKFTEMIRRTIREVVREALQENRAGFHEDAVEPMINEVKITEEFAVDYFKASKIIGKVTMQKRCNEVVAQMWPDPNIRKNLYIQAPKDNADAQPISEPTLNNITKILTRLALKYPLADGVKSVSIKEVKDWVGGKLNSDRPRLNGKKKKYMKKKKQTNQDEIPPTVVIPEVESPSTP